MQAVKLSLVSPPRVEDDISIEFMVTDLERSGLTPEDIGAYPISSSRYDGVGSYIIPYPSNTMWRTRIDRAVNKYIQPKNVVDVWWPHQRDPSKNKDKVLFIIEGEKKAARFYKQWPDSNVLGIGGAWNGTERMDDGSRRLLPNIQRCLEPEMRVIVIYDGDIETNVHIQMAAASMGHLLSKHACSLELFRPPAGKGVDDWLEQNVNAKFTDLIPIDIGDLEQSRKQLYTRLGCTLNDGKLVLNELNAKRLIFDYFNGAVYRDKRLGVIKDGEVIDLEKLEHDCIEYMQGTVNYHYKVPQIRQGMAMAFTQHRDLVQELILNTTWDGYPRLDTWGSEYFQSDFPAYADEWGRILMTSMGLRILKPGTKCDHVCILIGAQGIGKSTFFEDLATFDGHAFYYAITDMGANSGDSNRTQGQMFSRSVIVDLAEGVIFETRKAAMDRAKQMLTQTHDEYRVAYAKVPTIDPRGFIFVGTTNRRDQLGDQTGSRRFLNMLTTKITRLPYQEKLQILAEVKEREAEIRESEWYKIVVDPADVPAYLKERNEHITDTQELVNTQFQRSNEYAEMLEALIEANDLASLKDDPEAKYITAGYLAVRMGDDGTSAKHMASRMLSALSASPSYPYLLENQRKRLPQLNITEGQRFGYTQGIMNNQQMLNGYIVRRKKHD